MDAAARPGGERSLPRLGPRGEGWIGIQLAIQLAILVIAPATGPAWGDPLRLVTSVLGFPIVAAGIALFAWGASALGPSFSIWVAPRRVAQLTTQGPYRFVRHPICTAQVIVLLGWSLLSASLLALALLPLLVWYLDRFKLASEEEWLRETYKGYAAYARAVPHRMLFIPGRRAARSHPLGA